MDLPMTLFAFIIVAGYIAGGAIMYSAGRKSVRPYLDVRQSQDALLENAELLHVATAAYREGDICRMALALIRINQRDLRYLAMVADPLTRPQIENSLRTTKERLSEIADGMEHGRKGAKLAEDGLEAGE